jgi:hypothetical protein
MGARRWRRGGADRRQAKLDTARPAGAPPLAPIVAFEPSAGDGDGAVVATEPDLEQDAAGNGEPSMQESAVFAHSSPVEATDGDASVPDSTPSGQSLPVEPADVGSEAGEGDGDGDGDGAVVAAEPDLEPDGAGNGEPSTQESAVSSHSSPVDSGGPANSDASAAEPSRSGHSSPEEPTEAEEPTNSESEEVEANTKE